MTTASIQEVLATRVTTRVVSQIAAASSEFLRFFGFQPGAPEDGGGTAQRNIGHRQFGYDIFNDTRTVIQGRAPGTPAATTRRQAVGRVDGTFPRFYEKLYLPGEELHNYRVIGGSMNEYDVRGIQYVQRQQRYLGQRLANGRLVMTGGLLRGKLYGHRINGDDFYYDFNSANAQWTVDWKMPSGNTGQLPMNGGSAIITVPWDNSSADIPGNLMTIDKQLTALYGGRLDVVGCTSTMWNNIINNDHVIQIAGSADRPFEIYDRDQGVMANGKPKTTFRARIKACPWIDFIITNEVLDLGPAGSTTTTQLIDDSAIWFGPNPTNDLFEMYLGSEPVSEGPNQPGNERMGAHAWTQYTNDPFGYMIFSLDNSIPVNYVPNSNGYATVTGF